MKKLLIAVFSMGMASYICNAPIYGQGKGRGQGHQPDVQHGEHSVNRGPSDVRKPHRPDAEPPKHEDKGRTEIRQHELEHKQAEFEERLQRNPALRAKLESLLPIGTKLETASAGFKNQGQFIAALHVSKNLGIPFSELKAKMTGTNPMSLGQAIGELRPSMDKKLVGEEAKKAEKQAKETEKTKTPKTT